MKKLGLLIIAGGIISSSILVSANSIEVGTESETLVKEIVLTHMNAIDNGFVNRYINETSNVMAGESSYSDIASSPYFAEIEELNNYGIIKGYPNGEFRPGSNITRMEFLALFSHAANMKEWDTTVSVYADIPQRHWGIGYANFCYDYGYMRLIDGSDTIKNVDLDENGSVTRIEELQFIPEIASAYRKELQPGQAKDKLFPDDYISIDDALKLLINIMGYEASAEINGDYLKVAESIGLMNYVEYDENKYFTRENAAKLIHNALHIPITETRMNVEGTAQETVILDGENGKLYKTLLDTSNFQRKVIENTGSIPYKSDAQLIEDSDLIVCGVVNDILDSRWSNENFSRGENIRNILQTDIAILVEEAYKGNCENDTVVVRFDKGQDENTIYFSDGDPDFSKGEKVLLFLVRDDSDVATDEDYYVLTGMRQGKYVLSKENQYINGERAFNIEKLKSHTK